MSAYTGKVLVMALALLTPHHCPLSKLSEAAVLRVRSRPVHFRFTSGNTGRRERLTSSTSERRSLAKGENTPVFFTLLEDSQRCVVTRPQRSRIIKTHTHESGALRSAGRPHVLAQPWRVLRRRVPMCMCRRMLKRRVCPSQRSNVQVVPGRSEFVDLNNNQKTRQGRAMTGVHV